MGQENIVSPEEQTLRRKHMQDALTNARLSGLEPDPIIFEYIERYVHGEMTLQDIIADYTKRTIAMVEAQKQHGIGK